MLFCDSVHDVAPLTAITMEKVSKKYTFHVNDGMMTTTDKGFDMLESFPLFVNVVIDISLSDSCEERDLPSEIMDRYCVDITTLFEVMAVKIDSGLKGFRGNNVNEVIAKQHSIWKHIFHPHQSSYTGKEKYFTAHLDTYEGYLLYIASRYDSIIADLESLVFFMTRVTCESGMYKGLRAECGAGKREGISKILMNFKIDYLMRAPQHSSAFNINFIFFPK